MLRNVEDVRKISGEIPWVVAVRKGKLERVYKETAVNRYSAVVKAVDKFIKEFKLPGKAYDYFGGKKYSYDVEVSAKCGVDLRKQKAVDYSNWPQTMP